MRTTGIALERLVWFDNESLALTWPIKLTGITSVGADRPEASGQGPWNAWDLRTRQGS